MLCWDTAGSQLVAATCVYFEIMLCCVVVNLTILGEPQIDEITTTSISTLMVDQLIWLIVICSIKWESLS